MDVSLVFSWEQWSRLLLVRIILHLQGRKEQLSDTTLQSSCLRRWPGNIRSHTHTRKKSSSLIPRPHGLGLRLGVGSLGMGQHGLRMRLGVAILGMGQTWFENEVGSE